MPLSTKIALFQIIALLISLPILYLAFYGVENLILMVRNRLNETCGTEKRVEQPAATSVRGRRQLKKLKRQYR
jgi:hypothetical protein